MSAVKIHDFYRRELADLREQAAEFAMEHPVAARELAMSRGKSADPHVEMLLQSFAYLSGRLQYQLEAEQTTLPNAMLARLYPYLEAPLPSMLVTQAQVSVDGANFANGWTLERHRHAAIDAEADNGKSIGCRFRTAYETPIWPLKVSKVGIMPTNHYDFLSNDTKINSVLRVKVVSMGEDPIQELPLSKLRFYINSEEISVFHLYERLSVNLCGMALMLPDEDEPRRIPAECLRWMGFSEDEAILPTGPETHPGYRLLQEYFAFPEKFLFFEVDSLNLSGAIGSFELLFLLDEPPLTRIKIGNEALKLNCIPMINLFSHPLEPVRLDHREYEYRLNADRAHVRYSEVHSVERLTSVQPDKTPRTLVPYFSIERFDLLDQQNYFYATRRAESHNKQVPGTDLYASFMDMEFNPTDPPGEAIGGRALCTNRRLPEHLRMGDLLQLEGAGPISGLRIHTKPTPHQTPNLIGKRPWALVSQLSLNWLSFSEGGEEQILSNLKNMLRLHAGHENSTNVKQISSLVGMQAKPVVRNIRQEAWRGFCRGTQIHLIVDEDRLGGGSAVMLAAVLQHFFALYANINSFTQVSLESKQRKGVWKTWAPMAGAQTVL